MGRAVARVGEHDTAFPGPGAAVTYNVLASWTDAGTDDANRAWAREFARRLDDLGSPGGYVNFMTDVVPEIARDAYGRERLARLRMLKHQYDPTNLFRLNKNIAP